jgi:hypothetical protein
MSDQKKPDIPGLWQALATADEDFRSAAQNEAAAASITTSKLNELNRAQRAFDEAISQTKKLAPYRSDWDTARRREAERP